MGSEAESPTSASPSPPLRLAWRDKAEARKEGQLIDAWTVLEIAHAVEQGRLQPIPTAPTDPGIAGALGELDELDELDALIDAGAEPRS